MAQWLVQAIFAALLLVTLVSVIAGRRSLSSGWNYTSTFIFTVAWLLALPFAFVQFTGGLDSYVNIQGELVVLASGRAAQLAEISTVVVTLASSLALIFGLMRRNPISSAPLLGALLVVLVDLGGAASGVSDLASPRTVALLSIFLAAAVLPRGRGAIAGIAAFGVTFTLASCALALTDFDTAFRYCRSDKCGPLGNLFFGASNGENVLSLLLVATIPAVLLAFTTRARWFLACSIAITIFLSGSRTSLVAVVVILLVFALVRPNYADAVSGPRKALVVATFIIGIITGAALPFLAIDPSSFTNRAFLWQLARDDLAHQWLIGRGGLYWSMKVGVGEITRDQAYSVHNQFLDVWYTGGLLGIIVFLAMVLVALKSTSMGRRSISLLLLFPVIFTGLLERSWAFGILDVWAWLAAATLLAMPRQEAVGRIHPGHSQLGREDSRSEIRDLARGRGLW